MTTTPSFDFGTALRHLKSGARVARIGWNGKGMWLSYTPGREVDAHEFWSPSNAAWAAQRPVFTKVRDYITMKTADDEIVPWVASQTDMLAEDWVVLS